MRPIIGITCRRSEFNGIGQYILAAPYISAVERGGGIPLILPPFLELGSSLGSICQGLILSGGGDPDPALFNEKPHFNLANVDQERDAWEIFLSRTAREEGIPILGICRGLQILNVAFGGDLYQDISTFIPGAQPHMQSTPPECLAHSVVIAEESRLFKIIKQNRIRCNSLHHQAVRKVAPGLKVVAWAEDGVIEGLENSGGEFILGVQWHPERIRQPAAENLFFEFINKAGRR